MFEKFHDALNANDGVFDKDFSKVTFFANQMGILRVDLDKINLNNYNNFQEGNPDTIVHAKSLAWHNKFEKRKEFKENLSEELMPVAWHPAKLWDWCLSEDEKKGVQSTFTQSWKVGKSSTEAIGNSKSWHNLLKCFYSTSVVYKLVVLKHFWPENYAWKIDIIQK